jgi:hypothetical protein
MYRMKTYEDHSNPLAFKNIGFYSALSTAAITVVTFSIAVFTPPLSGPWCRSGCLEYPYLNIASRFPRDYYWMYPSMLLSVVFVLLMVSIHQYARQDKKAYSLSALLFAAISSTMLLIDYFIQVSVIQPSLQNGETDGIALLTQYNPHGIFIALEEIGYMLMSISFLCTIPVFLKNNRLERAIRATYFIGFLLNVIAFITILALYGIDREYRFELAVITINWMVLIVSGILLTILFKRFG